ncbi:MAG: glycosyltransferase family 2 protein [Candidatus Aenigmarchaeota archaeon]|nr:glycosyltransferase family 2 protein [Candidatus Aenigmarchaeota archaeon]
MSFPSISVVVCTRNRAAHLQKCIASLLSQSLKPKEIIVVDDASEEKDFVNAMNSVSINCKNTIKDASIIYLRNKKRQGVTKSRNLGIAVSSGEVVAFVDDDGYAHRHWLRNLAKHYRSKSVGGAGGPVVESKRAAGINRKWKGRITPEGDISHNYRIKYAKDARLMKPSPVKFLMGGNMSFRRDALIRLHGFDTRFKGNAYREETDICLRVSKKGKIIFEPRAIAYHNTAKDGGTRDISTMAHFLYWYFRNTTILFLRHFDFFDAIRKTYFQSKKFISSVIAGDLRINRAYLIKEGANKHIAAIVKGAVSGFFKSKGRLKKLDYEKPEDMKMLTVSAKDSRLQFAESRNIIQHMKLFIRCHFNGA